jgi:U3 small nucleolar RNA-associated protein 14
VKIAEIDTGKVIEHELPGWGTWGGPGTEVKLNTKTYIKPGGISKSKRQDRDKKHVIINEKRMKKVAIN